MAPVLAVLGKSLDEKLIIAQGGLTETAFLCNKTTKEKWCNHEIDCAYLISWLSYGKKREDNVCPLCDAGRYPVHKKSTDAASQNNVGVKFPSKAERLASGEEWIRGVILLVEKFGVPVEKRYTLNMFQPNYLRVGETGKGDFKIPTDFMDMNQIARSRPLGWSRWNDFVNHAIQRGKTFKQMFSRDSPVNDRHRILFSINKDLVIAEKFLKKLSKTSHSLWMKKAPNPESFTGGVLLPGDMYVLMVVLIYLDYLIEYAFINEEIDIQDLITGSPNSLFSAASIEIVIHFWGSIMGPTVSVLENLNWEDLDDIAKWYRLPSDQLASVGILNPPTELQIQLQYEKWREELG